jgi:hypothetical protein
MLNPEWDTNYCQEASNGGYDVTKGQPDAGKDKPQHVTNESKGASANIGRTRQLRPTNRLFPEWQERELTNHKAAFGPGQSDDSDCAQNPYSPPS